MFIELPDAKSREYIDSIFYTHFAPDGATLSIKSREQLVLNEFHVSIDIAHGRTCLINLPLPLLSVLHPSPAARFSAPAVRVPDRSARTACGMIRAQR